MLDVNRYLKDDEEILWKGRPEKFDTMDATNKKAFVKKCVICALVCAAVIGLYVWVSLANSTETSWVMFAIIVACSVASPINFFVRTGKIRKFEYVATDKKLLVLSERPMEMPYIRIKEWCLQEDDDGHVSLLCGKKAISAKPGQFRNIAAYISAPETDLTVPCVKFGFYAIDDPAGLEKVMKEKVPNK